MIMDNSQPSATPGSVSAKNSNNNRTIFKIGDLAREFGVTLRTLRFYEDRGLVNPGRSGTTRLYDVEDRERLRIALFCKRIGMSLGEIREVLELNDQSLAGRPQTAKLRQIYVAQLAKLQQQHKETGAAIDDLETIIAAMENTAPGA